MSELLRRRQVLSAGQTGISLPLGTQLLHHFDNSLDDSSGNNWLYAKLSAYSGQSYLQYTDGVFNQAYGIYTTVASYNTAELLSGNLASWPRVPYDESTSLNVSFWIKLKNSASGTYNGSTVINSFGTYEPDKQSGTGYTYGFYFGISTSGIIRYTTGAKGGGTSTVINTLTTTNLYDGAWHHIYYTEYLYDSTYMYPRIKLYVDGNLEYSSDLVSSVNFYRWLSSYISSTGQNYIGNRLLYIQWTSVLGTASDPSYRYLDDFIINYGPPIWTSNFTPPTEPWGDFNTNYLYNGSPCTDTVGDWYLAGGQATDLSVCRGFFRANTMELDKYAAVSSSGTYAKYYIDMSTASNAPRPDLTDKSKVNITFSNSFTIPQNVHLLMTVSSNRVANDTNRSSYLPSITYDALLDLTNQSISAGTVYSLDISSVTGQKYISVGIAGGQTTSTLTASISSIFLS